VLREAKQSGFSDREIGELWHMSEQEVFDMREACRILPVYKMIDTCASEFDSYIPYFYSTYEEETNP
jgi:Carbamoyl-phosphate synthetase large chain, oligomerisation domain.